MLYTKSTMKIVEGNTIWLERDSINGSKVDVSIFFGNHLKIDGLPDILRINPAVYSPDGAVLTPALHGRPDGYTLRFRPTVPGFYTVVAEMWPVILTRTPGGYREGARSNYPDALCSAMFRQAAMAIVEVGKDVTYEARPAGIALDIVPKKAYLEAGKKIELVVCYEGKKRQGLDVKAFSRKLDAERTYTTDKKGSVRIQIDADGTWLFMAKYHDTLLKAGGIYDESIFATTLVMSTVSEPGL